MTDDPNKRNPEPAPPKTPARTVIDRRVVEGMMRSEARRTPGGAAEAPTVHAKREDLRPGLLPSLAETRAATFDPGAPEPAPAWQAPGLRLNQYELIRELGEGGMGRVFFARDTILGRKVAIKFLHKSSRTMTDRFLVEARATARCSHENIVVIHEADAYEGWPYMVLEYLDGTPLSALMQGQPLAPNRAVELMVPVVRALVQAHALEVVHRDLKPENIFWLRTGGIKVLDFGIAKLFAGDEESTAAKKGVPPGPGRQLTRHGALVGTLNYMSPEQWGADTVDHRADLWAVGLLLFEMVTGENPLSRLSSKELMATAATLDEPMPRVRELVPEVPVELERIVDRCLAKRKRDRYQTAQALLDDLEPLLPGRRGRELEQDESPYPGLTAFQERDADRFFGRRRDTLQAAGRIRERPLTAIVGPSGVGKSSFVRAGVVPALKGSGESWEALTLRPGRRPLAALAALAGEVEEEELRDKPGLLGERLRQRARDRSEAILLLVDQFEELYTLVPEAAERRAFTACLLALADDPTSPLRLVLCMRSDLLDRTSEDPSFQQELTRGLLFLPPINREGLRDALTQPLELTNHRFESPELVDEILDTLEHTSGALPLLQFAATKLWDARDPAERLLSRASYEAMGGISGALASHADEVLAALDPAGQQLARSVFLRLVTADGTRAIVDLRELEDLADDAKAVRRVVDYLTDARLLTVQTEEAGPQVEIVHESLITGWPTLHRWLEESREDAAFLEQLRHTARQWAARERPEGLLWRGEAMEEARRFSRRHDERLPTREQDYLDAVFALADRAQRRRRRLIIGAFGALLLLVVAAGVALLLIRQAEQKAHEQARLARAAERRIKNQLRIIQDKERARRAAETAANQAEAKAAKGQARLKSTQDTLSSTQSKLKMSYQQLEQAYRQAREAQRRAEAASVIARDGARKSAEAARKNQQLADRLQQEKKKVELMLKKERARVRELERLRKKMLTNLK